MAKGGLDLKMQVAGAEDNLGKPPSTVRSAVKKLRERCFKSVAGRDVGCMGRGIGLPLRETTSDKFTIDIATEDREPPAAWDPRVA